MVDARQFTIDQIQNDLVTITDEGVATVGFHTGQDRAWDCEARFVFVFAGTQGGKTVFGPWWMNREIDRTANAFGGNDYIAVTANYDLFKLKMLPELRRVFEHILRRGRYWSGSRTIELHDPNGRFWAHKADDIMWGRIILRSAQAGGGLEAATAKAAWLDECGQDEFKIDHWEAVNRRVSIAKGRILGTTTLYNRGWVKSQIYDRWIAGDKNYAVISFPSFLNPPFPKDEYDRIVATLPKWKVNMFYRGEFDIPAGLIYDNLDESLCKIRPFKLDTSWKVFGFMDFGAVNTAAIRCVVRKLPDGKNEYYLTDEYWEGGRTAQGHADALKDWGVGQWFGGAKSEDQWRLEFRKAGLSIKEPPMHEVEVGIDRVYGAHVEDRIFAFDTLDHYWDQKGTYRRELDAEGVPTEKIADKETYHLMDAERYGIGTLERARAKAKVVRLG